MFDFTRNAPRALAAAAVSLLLAACGGSDDTPAPPPFGQTTVVFGASVSDTGNACNLSATNCPPAPPYATGRFSNGPLWVETVAARYGATATPSRLNGYNYAYAGATTGTVPGTTVTNRPPSMVAQVDQYLTRVGFQVNPQNLVILDGVTVGNNIADALTQVLAGNPNAPTAVLTQAVTDMVSMITRLYAAGARTIVVLNSVNIGLTPRVTSLNNPVATAGATQMSQQFNGALAQQIAALRAASPGLNVSIVDAYALEAAIVAAPAANGFNNVTAPCFVTSPAPAVCATPDTYYYWDSFHPTFVTGQRVAQEVIRVIGR
ncbi:MAG TPA: SGNH/GDSL hydrolase family protein [Burkholderiaceae bacterium]|nr:SGNH/GDSL hydrolase family protein [Burkholderiaceae bacterium]